jgi:hypothetical protein
MRPTTPKHGQGVACALRRNGGARPRAAPLGTSLADFHLRTQFIVPD